MGRATFVLRPHCVWPVEQRRTNAAFRFEGDVFQMLPLSGVISYLRTGPFRPPVFRISVMIEESAHRSRDVPHVERLFHVLVMSPFSSRYATL